MPYVAEITRSNPSCFVFLVDQSRSMLKPFGGRADKRKADGVADAINRLIQNLILKCAKADGVRDYFSVGVIGYGGQAGPALGGKLAGHTLVPLSTVADNPLRVEQRTRTVNRGAAGAAEESFRFPVWFEPKADGRTPMCKALKLAAQYLEVFLARYPACYPPVVIHITDGMATDGDPLPRARAVQRLASADGHVLLFNVHISSSPAAPIEFPAAEAGLPDNFARLLFRMSSPLPPPLLEAARADQFLVCEGSRGFVFNANLVSVIRFLDIGTRVAQSTR
jgi:hypothetical protein